MNYLQTDRITREFLAFHADNPDVYDDLVTMARQWQEMGHGVLGIATLFEVMRWNRRFAGKDTYGFKLNNNYAALYARLIMEQEPDLNGMFRLRERTAKIERIA